MLKEVKDISKLQSELLNVLLEFDKVCKKLNLAYTLTGGTLLGAVRHKGFIPWDDDIDVAMTRENYEKFLKEGQKLLKENYFLQTYDTDAEHIDNFAKVLNLEIPIVEKYKTHLKIKKGIFIDVFPIDKTFNNYFLRFMSVNTIRFLKLMIVSNKFSSILKISNSYLKIGLKLLIFPFAYLFKIRTINKLENFIRSIANNNSNKYTFADMDYSLFNFTGKEIDWNIYKHYMEIDFEGHKFMCIKDYDTYLKTVYGDYMQLPPIEQRIAHHNLLVEVNDI